MGDKDEGPMMPSGPCAQSAMEVSAESLLGQCESCEATGSHNVSAPGGYAPYVHTDPHARLVQQCTKRDAAPGPLASDIPELILAMKRLQEAYRNTQPRKQVDRELATIEYLLDALQGKATPAQLVSLCQGYLDL